MRVIGGISKLRRPKVFVPILIIIVLLAAAVAIIKNLTAPAVGSISQTPPAQSQPADPYAQAGTYTGKYISFKYPPHFKKVPSETTGSVLEVADYHSLDLTGKQISIGVYRDSIANSSDIQFRRQRSDIYKENDSQKWVEFTRGDGTEDTFFLEHSGLLASVSATTPNGGLNGEASFVASSLKWLAN